ncbi:MAG: hypothetical protein JNK60_08385 [Acidobacteria bacterium]|nr:hypothetical protein [Acidobacteriota bacterium]
MKRLALASLLAALAAVATPVSLSAEGLTLKVRTSEGWQPEVKSKTSMASTLPVSQDEPIEQIVISCKDVPLKYQVFVAGEGWQGARKSGEVAGTEGKRIEALRISAERGDVMYRVVPVMGSFSKWVKNGADSGRPGSDLPLAAIEVEVRDYVAASKLLEYRAYIKGSGFTPWTKAGVRIDSGDAGITAIEVRGWSDIRYEVSTTRRGWQKTALVGRTAGEAESGEPIEALRIFGGTYPIFCWATMAPGEWGLAAHDGKDCGSAGRGLVLRGFALSLSSEL